jgi:hypothetical protein
MKIEPDRDGETIIVLEARLNAALNGADPSRDDVRNIICALVDEMKSEGAPPEKVLIRVKNAFTGRNGAKKINWTTLSDGERVLRERERLLSEAVTWCIERYYSATN